MAEFKSTAEDAALELIALELAPLMIRGPGPRICYANTSGCPGRSAVCAVTDQQG